MKLKDALWVEPVGNYASRPIPVHKDELIRGALRDLEGRSPAETAPVLAGFALEERELLDAFAVRMASLAVRTGDVRHIRDGWLAIEVALRTGSTMMEAGAPLYHGFVKLGLNAREEFRALAELATGLAKESAEIIAKKGVPLEITRFREGRDEDGFRFVTVRELGLDL